MTERCTATFSMPTAFAARENCTVLQYGTLTERNWDPTRSTNSFTATHTFIGGYGITSFYPQFSNGPLFDDGCVPESYHHVQRGHGSTCTFYDPGVCPYGWTQASVWTVTETTRASANQTYAEETQAYCCPPDYTMASTLMPPGYFYSHCASVITAPVTAHTSGSSRVLTAGTVQAPRIEIRWGINRDRAGNAVPAGVKAAIGVGVGLAVLAGALLVFCCWKARRRRRESARGDDTPYLGAPELSTDGAIKRRATELEESTKLANAELDAGKEHSQKTELPGTSPSYFTAELAAKNSEVAIASSRTELPVERQGKGRHELEVSPVGQQVGNS